MAVVIGRMRGLVAWARQSSRTGVELVGVLAIAGAGFTVHAGWALLIVGGYLVLAANTTTRSGGRR